METIDQIIQQVFSRVNVGLVNEEKITHRIRSNKDKVLIYGVHMGA